MQPTQVDLKSITDIKELKVMVYDNLVEKERVEANINNLNARIAQLLQGGDGGLLKAVADQHPKKIDVASESENAPTDVNDAKPIAPATE